MRNVDELQMLYKGKALCCIGCSIQINKKKMEMSVVGLQELCLNVVIDGCLGFCTESEYCSLVVVVSLQLEINQDCWVV